MQYSPCADQPPLLLQFWRSLASTGTEAAMRVQVSFAARHQTYHSDLNLKWNALNNFAAERQILETFITILF